VTKALDLITDALQLLSVYDPNEPLADSDAQRGLTTLNDMMDSWSNESLTCYAIVEQSTVLVPGQQSYTIGPGGQINTTRPIRLIEGPGAAYVQDSNGNNYGIEVVPRNKWNMYGNRSSIVTSNFPDTLFYDPQYPLGVLNFMPYPSAPYTAFWDSYLQLSDFANLDTQMTLPPGYALAIKTNLACYLKPYYLSSDLPADLIAQASASKANIKRSNMRPLVALFDGAIVSRAGISFNIYTDRSGSSTSGAG
jgi:hypothetical protein